MVDLKRLYRVAYKSIVRKEVSRFMRIWAQTLVPPAITMTLYFVIFGNLIGERIGPMGGFDYLQYIAPGLIMMAVITSSYANVVSSFFSAKFQKHIEEMLVAPISHGVLLAGYVTGGMVRGLIVGVVVTAVALAFTRLQVAHPGIMLLSVVLTSMLFALAGFTNGMVARSFDDTSVVPTFVLTPLTYLGGVFYSVELLPELWRGLSMANPILYMVNAFRYGVLGVSDVSPALALGATALAALGMVVLNLWMLRRGVGIRS